MIRLTFQIEADKSCTKLEETRAYAVHIKDIIRNDQTFNCELKAFVDKFYKIFCERNGHTLNANEKSLEDKLDYIVENVIMVKEIIVMCKKMMKDEIRSTIAQCSTE